MPPARPTPLFGERALHLADERTLVVGDVHVGLETEARKAGLHVPSQTNRMRERLERLVTATEAARLVVIGDLKHMVPVSSDQEEDELPGFFRGLPCSVELVRGNHDVDIDWLEGVTVHPAEGIRMGDVGLAHGHSWPSQDVMSARTIVTCHNHPAVMLVDKLGHRAKEPAWVRASFAPGARARYPGLPGDARLVVMPAFNELVGGIAFNALEGERLLGPLFGNALVDVEGARVFTLDGLDLGRVADLRALGDGGPRGRKAAGKRAARKRPGWID